MPDSLVLWLTKSMVAMQKHSPHNDSQHCVYLRVMVGLIAPDSAVRQIKGYIKPTDIAGEGRFAASKLYLYLGSAAAAVQRFVSLPVLTVILNQTTYLTLGTKLPYRGSYVHCGFTLSGGDEAIYC